VLLSCPPATVKGQPALAYSFEFDTEGFQPNGGNFPINQDTIGATEGTGSLKVEVPSGATFVGALTTQVDHVILGDPPGVDHVLFDLTITEPFGPPAPDPPGFAVIGVSIFGHGGGMFGLHVQFQGDPVGSSEQHIEGLEPGTYRDLRIDLKGGTHPLTFETNQSFNDIFCTDLECGENDLLPSGFQFYFNKTGSQSSHPLTVYIDNVRFVPPGEGIPGDYNDNGTVDAADYVLWRDGGPLANEVADPGTVSSADYDEWRARFGNVAAASGAVQTAAVPEPASALLLIIGITRWWSGLARRRS
jgi:hypothetical protein